MEAFEALDRVKKQLSRGWLAHRERIAGLKLTGSDRADCGEFEIRSVFVERSVEDAEEPLGVEPTDPSRPFDLWTPQWPPASEIALVSSKIDVRHHIRGQALCRVLAAGRNQVQRLRHSCVVPEHEDDRHEQNKDKKYEDKCVTNDSGVTARSSSRLEKLAKSLLYVGGSDEEANWYFGRGCRRCRCCHGVRQVE